MGFMWVDSNYKRSDLVHVIVQEVGDIIGAPLDPSGIMKEFVIKVEDFLSRRSPEGI